MKCLYYLAPSLKSTHDISDDLHEVGINDFFLHVISRDESGLKKQHIHSSNYLETLDLIRDGLIGAVATLFGAWEGGLVGVATENKKLERFHDDLEAGKYLMLIYALKEKEEAVRRMMDQRHPEAEFVAVDSHFVNPFSAVRRGSDPDAAGKRAL
jgi:hypothetical protein